LLDVRVVGIVVGASDETPIGFPTPCGQNCDRVLGSPLDLQLGGVALALLLLSTRGRNVGLNQRRLGLAWGGSILHGLLVDAAGRIGALALLPTVSASRFIRLLTM
jgi:hypothetical protein